MLPRRTAALRSRLDTATRSRLRRDLLWWLVLTVPVVGMMLPFHPATGWDAAVVIIGNAAALRLRHSVPPVAFMIVIAVGSWLADRSAGSGIAPGWSVLGTMTGFVVAYLVGRTDSGDSLLRRALALLSCLAVVVPVLRLSLFDGAWLTVYLVFVVVFPWLIGRYRQQHAELLTAGWNRAEQLEREQRAVAEQARLRERTRIAEDMHDSLGHELSLIALRAAALEVDAELPRRHQEAAGELRRSAAVATERLREIIGLLREDAPASVTPVDETVADLVDRARASGIDIALTVNGSPEGLPRMVDRAVHRVVQESITNAAKHAPGRGVLVEITHTTANTTVDVENELTDHAVSDAVSGGRGLVGLAERVRVAGGRLRSGAEAGRFRVTATLPHDQVDPEPDRQPVTESRQRHTEAKVRTRRRLIAAIAVPAAALVALGIGAAVVFFVVTTNSVLTADRYQALRIGQSHESVDRVLPVFQVPDPPVWMALPAGLPDDADCEYYAMADDRGLRDDVYRLCFVSGKLADKSVVPQ